MKLDRIARATRHRAPSRRSTLVSLIALAVIVFGSLSMTSTHAGHDLRGNPAASGPNPHIGIEPRVAPVAADPVTAVAVTAAAVTVVAATVVAATAVSLDAHTGLGVVGCPECGVDCAILAMACATLLVLASLTLLSRSPSLYRRLLDAGGRSLRRSAGPVLDIHRPSLIVLSISRT